MTYEIAVAEIRLLRGAINRYQDEASALIDELEDVKTKIDEIETMLKEVKK